MIGTDFYEILFKLHDIGAYENKYSKEELDFFRNEYDFIYKQFKNAFILTVQPLIEDEVHEVFNLWNLYLKDFGSYNNNVTIPMQWNIGFGTTIATIEAGSSAVSYWEEINPEWIEDINIDEDIDLNSIDYKQLVIKLFYYLIQDTDFTIMKHIKVIFNKKKSELTDEESRFVIYMTNKIQDNKCPLIKNGLNDFEIVYSDT